MREKIPATTEIYGRRLFAAGNVLIFSKAIAAHDQYRLVCNQNSVGGKEGQEIRWVGSRQGAMPNNLSHTKRVYFFKDWDEMIKCALELDEVEEMPVATQMRLASMFNNEPKE